MRNPVGPILRMGDEVESVIAALEEDNPNTEIEVIDRGSYVRVQGEDELRPELSTIKEDRLLEPILDFLSRRVFGADRLRLLGVEP